jgi:hypothetical protein
MTGGVDDRRYLSNWETNCRQLPGVERVIALAILLNAASVVWCALVGKIHPTIAAALRDPVFARFVFDATVAAQDLPTHASVPAYDEETADRGRRQFATNLSRRQTNRIRVVAADTAEMPGTTT